MGSNPATPTVKYQVRGLIRSAGRAPSGFLGHSWEPFGSRTRKRDQSPCTAPPREPPSRVAARLLRPGVVIPAPAILRIAKRMRNIDASPRHGVITKEVLGHTHGYPPDGIHLLRLPVCSIVAVSSPAPSTSVWKVCDLGNPAVPFHRDLLWLPRAVVDRAGPLLTRCLLGDPPGRSQMAIGSAHSPAHQRSLCGKHLSGFMHPPQGMQVGKLPVCEQLRHSRGFVSVDQAFLTTRRDPTRDLAGKLPQLVLHPGCFGSMRRTPRIRHGVRIEPELVIAH